MKIPVQEKIAELERRIQALEKQRQPPAAETPTSTQREHLNKMWSYYDLMFSEMRKVFR